MPVTISGTTGVQGNLTGAVTGNLTGNASTATLATTIADGAVTTSKLALSAVTADRINLVTSLSSNGYQIMPNGLIMQWGNTGTSGFFNSPGKRLLVTFPVPFPTACLNVQGTAYVYDAGTYVAVPEIYSLTRTQVGWQDGDNDSTPWDIHWFAIGF